MMQKNIVGLFFLMFIAIRLFYGRGKDERKKFHHMRELSLTSVFTFTLLGCYISYFSQDSAQYPMNYSQSLVWVGALLGGMGNLLLLWVHHCLGKNFSPHLEIREEHKLIQHGPYQFIRHPMYTSGYLFLLGCGLVSQDALLLFPPVITFSLLLVFRLSDEEKMLQEKFGEEWVSYVEKTSRVIPKIW
jgi:protein-S-isoprenylcysteine O-methyltransferase Ste14